MTLSKRATDFLRKSEREGPLLTEAEIRKAFVNNEAPISSPLIDFQVNYGGYLFKTGLEPIKFSLLKGTGGFPKRGDSAIIEFEESELHSPKYFFDCASTQYQMYFHLDEQGVYYEDYKPKASCFSKMIEHLALWNEINMKESFKLLFRDKKLQTIDIDKKLQLSLLTEASDQYTLWFGNENMYMQQCEGLTTLLVSSSYPHTTELLKL